MEPERKQPIFDTERLRQWRCEQLSESQSLTLKHIEDCGWEATHIDADGATPRVSYTTGVFDTAGKPELIVVGLRDDTAHFALGEAIRLLQEGVNVTEGRHREVVGEVDVEFREVAPKWLHHVMPRAEWYYLGKDVPVLQIIYPDLENRFQWEDGFNVYYRQPILSLDAMETQTEQDFWKAFDPKSSFFNWRFPDSPHTQAFLSKMVHDKEEAVTYVSHEAEDGAWQFLGDKMSEGGGPVLSCLHHPIDDDRSLQELGDLPLGWYAVRSAPGEPWERFEHEPENEDAETPEPQ